MQIIIVLVLFIGFIFADDYSFNMDEIEVKTYEYNGYLKAEQKNQKTKNNTYQNSSFGEVQLNFKYFKKNYTLNTQLQLNHKNINNSEKNNYTTNQLFLNYKATSNHSVAFGKKSLKWGKGYFFNPVAFLDRKKDPNNPESSREGYILSNYKYNKSYNGDLKNFSLDIVAMPISQNINDDFSNQSSTNIALKSYFLYFDTDIDIIYFYNDRLKDKIGIDFSKNLETNFEIHAETAKEFDGYTSYLIGFKYLTTFELTITSEYFYRSIQLIKSEPFYDHRYFINKFSLKEPFSIVYSSIYYKNSLNTKDNSFQNSLGGIYNFKNNITIDISYNQNKGDSLSEFGSKQIEDTIYSKVIWYF